MNFRIASAPSALTRGISLRRASSSDTELSGAAGTTGAAPSVMASGAGVSRLGSGVGSGAGAAESPATLFPR